VHFQTQGDDSVFPNENLSHSLYNGSVVEKLQIARKLLHQHGELLKNSDGLGEVLDRMRLLAAQLQDHMTAMDMGRLCVRCAARAGGGCCSLYMAGETDAVQLLLNMLAGVTVEPVRDDGVECCYLGPRGCIFLFKPMFCLNYNCTHILQDASPVELARLESLAGQLLGQQYDAEKIILDCLTRQIKR